MRNKRRRRDYRCDSSFVVCTEVVVEALHDPSRHTVVNLIADMLPAVVEKESVTPVFTDVALVCRTHLPANDVVSME